MTGSKHKVGKLPDYIVALGWTAVLFLIAGVLSIPHWGA